MAQQTAVEWLFEKMAQTPITNWYEVREKALAMEKEQIMMAFHDSDMWNTGQLIDSERYYKETYEKNSTHN